MSVNPTGWETEKTKYGWTKVLHGDDDLIVRYRSINRGQNVPLQYHTLTQRFFYVISGIGRYENHEGTPYIIRPGDRFSVPAGEKFYLAASETHDLVLLESYPIKPGDEAVMV